MQLKKSIFGATLLITGCCIGAGILGLPIVSLPSGFLFSLIPLVFGWSYMYLSGLMILEVYIGEKKNINLTGLLKKTLGNKSKIIGAGLFVFLFYSLLTAYLSGSSIIIKDFIYSSFQLNLSQSSCIVLNATVLFFIILFRTKKIDFINRILVILMFIFYFCLIGLGSFQIKIEKLLYIQNIRPIVYATSIFIVSFGYQNLIPTIAHYLDYDVNSVKTSIFRGSFIAFILYLIWNFTILGMISNQTLTLNESDVTFITRLFKYSPPMILFFINNFSLLAIVTSLISVSLSFVNFISNSSENTKDTAFYTACTIIPPTIFAILNPNIFLTALKIAGGIGTICLFGILPSMMLWQTRYVKHNNYKKVFPFNKNILICYILISIFLICLEIFNLRFL